VNRGSGSLGGKLFFDGGNFILGALGVLSFLVELIISAFNGKQKVDIVPLYASL